ncbi:AroM family protein [Salipiger sp. P9]|uniref:AroM family protein n=1 Tax=Salipiger pentaromativorans TaxID=2943193 RepID=UPI002157A05A|nr:AroM family protein [Salipiger pentaromativorans]MCR8546923.1 AroM family protein [Salipiger pentaromativorans]
MTVTRRAAIVSIGQTPRPGQTDELARVLSPGIELVQRGALDDLSNDEITAAAPGPEDSALFTYRRDGMPITVSHDVVTAGVQRRLDELASEGFDVTLLSCTGTFPELRGAGVLLRPSRILDAVVGAVFERGRLGVLVPLPEQVGKLTRKWEREGVTLVAEALRPGSSPEEIDAAAARLAAGQPELIVMDCMGYTAADKARIGARINRPVVLAVACAARVMEELTT